MISLKKYMFSFWKALLHMTMTRANACKKQLYTKRYLNSGRLLGRLISFVAMNSTKTGISSIRFVYNFYFNLSGTSPIRTYLQSIHIKQFITVPLCLPVLETVSHRLVQVRIAALVAIHLVSCGLYTWPLKYNGWGFYWNWEEGFNHQLRPFPRVLPILCLLVCVAVEFN